MDWRKGNRNPKANLQPESEIINNSLHDSLEKKATIEGGNRDRRPSFIQAIMHITSKRPPSLNTSSFISGGKSTESPSSATLVESAKLVNQGRYRRGSFSVCRTKETSTLVQDLYEETGYKFINQYFILRDIGYGIHGKVKLCYDTVKKQYCAMKVIHKNPRRSFTSRFISRSNSERVQKHSNLQVTHMNNIRKEIAIMKACSHPNIVKLYEVIDSPEENNIYLFLEYMERGEIKWKTEEEPHRPIMTQDEARVVFRDLLCGIEYLHYQGIVHRDIKPANLLWDNNGRVKIADFSVSAIAWPHLRSNEPAHSSDILAIKKDFNKLVGSPAFFAPELCYKEYINSLQSDRLPSLPDLSTRLRRRKSLGSLYELKVVKPRHILSENTGLKESEPLYYQVPLNRTTSTPEIRSSAFKVEQTASLPIAITSDIWAIGITLYCIIYGRVPFYGESRHELFKAITTSKLKLPDDIPTPEDLEYLITSLLDKEPTKRIPIKKAKMAHWTTADMTKEEAKKWLYETDPRVMCGDAIEATNEDIKNALTKLLSRIYHRMRGFGGAFNASVRHKSFLRRSR